MVAKQEMKEKVCGIDGDGTMIVFHSLLGTIFGEEKVGKVDPEGWKVRKVHQSEVKGVSNGVDLGWSFDSLKVLLIPWNGLVLLLPLNHPSPENGLLCCDAMCQSDDQTKESNKRL